MPSTLYIITGRYTNGVSRVGACDSIARIRLECERQLIPVPVTVHQWARVAQNEEGSPVLGWRLIDTFQWLGQEGSLSGH